MVEIAKYIDLVSIELVGSEYREEQEVVLRQEFDAEPFATIVRGRHAIAAGVGLSQALAMFVSGAIASGILYDLFKYVLSTVRRAINADVPLNKVTFKTRYCDYVISSNCAAGVCSELIDYNQLFSQMESFVKTEANNNRSVVKIEAPCDLQPTQSGWECICGDIGNYSLWKVEYKSGDKWPEALYDVANKSFIELDKGEIGCLQEDIFYSGEMGS